MFQSLKYTKDPEILIKLIKVINFYIKYDSPMQKAIINPDTILWLLEIVRVLKFIILYIVRVA